MTKYFQRNTNKQKHEQTIKLEISQSDAQEFKKRLADTCEFGVRMADVKSLLSDDSKAKPHINNWIRRISRVCGMAPKQTALIAFKTIAAIGSSDDTMKDDIERVVRWVVYGLTIEQAIAKIIGERYSQQQLEERRGVNL